MRVPFVPHPGQNALSLELLILAILTGIRWNLRVVSICIFIMTKCQVPKWIHFSFRFCFKDRLRFWLSLSYRPWRTWVVNSHCTSARRKTSYSCQKLASTECPDFVENPTCLISSPACINSLRYTACWTLIRKHVLVSFFTSPVPSILSPSLLGSPVEDPWRTGQLAPNKGPFPE